MRRLVFSLPLAAAVVAWASPSLAQRQQAVGPGIIPLNAAGIAGGVDMSVSGTTGTLNVGVPGGPPTDIFTQNVSLTPGPVAVSTAASSQGNIVFNSSSTVFGAVGATQPAGPFLRNITGGNTGTTVNFQGPVYATTLNVAQTGAVNFNSGSTNITATNFAGDGRINLAPNTTLIGALTTTAGANTGTLSLGSGSVLDGAVGGAVGLRSINVVGGNDQAGVVARITGAANAYSFSLGTNTLLVDGALTIANTGPGGVINTTLASPSVYGNIRPVGATNLGPTLQVNVNVPSTAFIPVGTQFNVVQTRTGTVQSGTNGSVLAITVQNPTNPLYTFVAVPEAGTIAGQVTIRTTGIPLLVPIQPPPGVVLPPTLPVATAIVPILVAIAPSAGAPPLAGPPSDLVATVLPALNALSDPTVVVNAIAQLAPSAAIVAAPLVTFQGNRQFHGMLLSRLDDILCGPVRHDDGQAIRLDEDVASCRRNQASGWWLKGFAYSGRQGSRGAFGEYASQIYGVMIAYDTPVGPNTRVGMGLGYAYSNVDGKTFESGSARTQFSSYRATAYIGHEQGPWYLHGDATFGVNSYTGVRRIAFPGIDRKASSDYGGQEYTGFVTTGYRIPVQSVTITPLASLQYTHMNLGNYTEAGAGDINLRVKSQSYDFLESGLGVRVSRAVVRQDTTYVPEVHAKWLHELSNPTLTNTSAFTAVGSTSFKTPGLRAAADTFNFGGGVTLLSCNCTTKPWSLEAIYDYFWRNDNYSAHQGMVRFSSRF